MIEDSPSGSRVGYAAGCKALATTFTHRIDQLEVADRIVESLGNVEALILPDDVGPGIEVSTAAAQSLDRQQPAKRQIQSVISW